MLKGVVVQGLVGITGGPSPTPSSSSKGVYHMASNKPGESPNRMTVIGKIRASKSHYPLVVCLGRKGHPGGESCFPSFAPC